MLSLPPRTFAGDERRVAPADRERATLPGVEFSISEPDVALPGGTRAIVPGVELSFSEPDVALTAQACTLPAVSSSPDGCAMGSHGRLEATGATRCGGG